MNILQFGAMRTDRYTDRQTDMMKLIVAFRSFVNAIEYDTT